MTVMNFQIDKGKKFLGHLNKYEHTVGTGSSILWEILGFSIF
jgi:hypothetical protein